MTVARAAQIEENGHARRANGDVCQAKAPGTAEGVADDDGDAFAGSFAERGGNFFCGAIRISREQGYGIVARNIRMIHTCIRADVAVERFGNQHGIATAEAARFFQDYFHESGVSILPPRYCFYLSRRINSERPT